MSRRRTTAPKRCERHRTRWAFKRGREHQARKRLVSALEPLLPLCDLVLVMTVKPGFGGQTLREDCVAKIPEIRKMIERTGRDILIEVDGGVKQSNAARVIDAGADVLVMGTGLFRAEDPKAVVQSVIGGVT